ncbi:unnamed protein product [Parascedosporium putredinis]|uniref:Uncharacterized protein n=1 Tax=Parascedosporium putredinis TaxID=1442378 RepID=A0A9P1MAH9_9PEZI|nr:unnamed protein product [Parascedosporium putredinis]CAI7992834.1 unnamed protein product [Parascedosporium putredinis]
MVRSQILAAAVLGQITYSGAVSVPPVRTNVRNLISTRGPEPDNGSLVATAGKQNLMIMNARILYWAAEDGTVAELTVSMTGAAESIVNLERIDDMVVGVECPDSGTASGEMRIRFQEAADLDDAEDVWQWVNQEPGNHFVLVVGAGACGWNNNRRVVYNVAGLVYNDESETVVLDVAETTWREAAHTFSLSLGKPAGGVAKRAERGETVVDAVSDAAETVADTASDLMDKAKGGVEKAIDTAQDVADDVVDAVTDATDKAVDATLDIVDKVGDATEEAVGAIVDGSKDATDKVVEAVKSIVDPDTVADFAVPFDSDFTGETVSFAAGEGLDVSATCKECFTKGSLDIRGNFRVTQFRTEEAWIEISTAGLTAKAVLGLALKAEITGKLFEQSVPVFQAAPAGLSIPGVLTVGPTVAVKLGAEISQVKGVVGLTLGGTATIPASTARLDFLSEDRTSGSGWEPVFEAEPVGADASVEAKATAFLRASVGLEISAVETGFSAELSANLPSLTASFKALTASTCTVCGDHQAGVQGNLVLGTSLAFNLKQKVLGDSKPLWSLPLADATLADLGDFCLGIGPSGDQCLAKRGLRGMRRVR